MRRWKSPGSSAFTTQVGGEHHEVIPNHNPSWVKPLSSILKSIARHQDMSVEQLLRQFDL